MSYYICTQVYYVMLLFCVCAVEYVYAEYLHIYHRMRSAKNVYINALHHIVVRLGVL